MRLLSHGFRWLILGYRYGVSPWLPVACRFQPTCSHYALEALNRHPLHRALPLILRRLLRCHPWGGHGFDPVPDLKSSTPSPAARQTLCNPVTTQKT